MRAPSPLTMAQRHSRISRSACRVGSCSGMTGNSKAPLGCATPVFRIIENLKKRQKRQCRSYAYSSPTCSRQYLRQRFRQKRPHLRQDRQDRSLATIPEFKRLCRQVPSHRQQFRQDLRQKRQEFRPHLRPHPYAYQTASLPSVAVTLSLTLIQNAWYIYRNMHLRTASCGTIRSTRCDRRRWSRAVSGPGVAEAPRSGRFSYLAPLQSKCIQHSQSSYRVQRQHITNDERERGGKQRYER